MAWCFLSFTHASAKVFLKTDSVILSCYGVQGYSYYLELKHHILSQGGVQQGNSLGLVLFWLATKRLISSLTSELNIWCLDEGTL